MKSLIESIQSSKPACGAGVALCLFAVFLGVLGILQPIRMPSSVDELGALLAVSIIQKLGCVLLIGLGFVLLDVFLKPFRRPINE